MRVPARASILGCRLLAAHPEGHQPPSLPLACYRAQVAEAFAVDMVGGYEAAAQAYGADAPPLLHHLVQLDTCVTVVDAANLMDNL